MTGMRFGTRLLRIVVLASLSVGMESRAQPIHEWTPTASLISKVESKISMPPGTLLNSYTRYYYGLLQHRHRLLVGIFVRDGGTSTVHITSQEKAPAIFEGGCDVVNLKYDVDADKVLAVFCNGRA
ncbi:hypothetical protein BTI_2233 [Burkholderia thailandensis MSMB121]|uniref:hypothetical protein n=1 Tax=Burkholderia humptydooensis TaxID=430531 RepID=UPI00032801A7|nr:hypothetical protein [Burkholderia humptydooensis]AGK47507.1 hypothetical protein BTI_2233 [Burkholderia thailandensis MSMB121]ATF37234.1 hypothetical protein CO709_31080 [Burkholderia thailandensis]KST74608.1 hypothetical protein WS76_10865 [Burkholderia humptydooensis]